MAKNKMNKILFMTIYLPIDHHKQIFEIINYYKGSHLYILYIQ